MSELDSFYTDLDKREKFVPEDGKYVGHFAVKGNKTYITPNKQFGAVDFAMTFDSGEYKGRWVWGRLNVQDLTAITDADNLAKAKVAYGIAHRTIKALTGGKKSDQGLADKEGWSTEELLDYTTAVLASVNGKAIKFTTKRRVDADGEPITDKNGDQRYTVYLNGIAE